MDRCCDLCRTVCLLPAGTYLTAKQQKVNAAKCRKVPSANCGTTQVLKDSGNGDENMSPKADAYSSALTSGSKKESKKVSPSASNASPFLREVEQVKVKDAGVYGDKAERDQNQPQSVQEFWENGGSSTSSFLLNAICPQITDDLVKEQLPLCDDILAFFDEEQSNNVYGVPKKYQGVAAEMVLEWNRAHRSGKYATKEDKKLFIYKPKQFLKALNGDLLNQYHTHDFENCETCKDRGCVNYHSYVREQVTKHEAFERARIFKEQAAAEALRKEPLCMHCENPHTFKWQERQGVTEVTWKLCDAHYDEEVTSRSRVGVSAYGKPRLEPRLHPEPVTVSAKSGMQYFPEEAD